MRGTSQSPTARRLMVYLSGVAIGLVMLGMFNAQRTREKARREAEAAAAAREAAVEPAADPSQGVPPELNPS